MTKVEEWIAEWSKVPRGSLFPGDEEYLKEVECELKQKRKQLWETSEAPAEPRNGRFHRRLSPMPYIGSLKTAKIFLLMWNPSVNAHDYEDLTDEVQGLFQRNIRQDIELSCCFALKDKRDGIPMQAWTAYFRGPNHGKPSLFGRLIETIRKRDGDALVKLLETKLAILELVPYYSQNAELIRSCRIAEGRARGPKCPSPSGLRQGGLPSAQLALAAVKEIAGDHSNLIIPYWSGGSKRWGLKTQGNLNQGVCAKIVEHQTRNGLNNNVKDAIRAKLRQIALGRQDQCTTCEGRGHCTACS